MELIADMWSEVTLIIVEVTKEKRCGVGWRNEHTT